VHAHEEPVWQRAVEAPAAEQLATPVVVEHIAEVPAESRIDLTRTTGEGYAPIAVEGEPVAKDVRPELIPVRASVFDDDFFRRPKEEDLIKSGDEPVQKQWPDARVPSFAGYATEGSAEKDELDIPAFLRRKQ
jgi:hypothetical protein